jgi:hypothetical protein
LWPNARLAPGLDLALAVEDGSGRRMGFMVACVAPGPALEDELR